MGNPHTTAAGRQQVEIPGGGQAVENFSVKVSKSNRSIISRLRSIWSVQGWPFRWPGGRGGAGQPPAFIHHDE